MTQVNMRKNTVETANATAAHTIGTSPHSFTAICKQVLSPLEKFQPTDLHQKKLL